MNGKVRIYELSKELNLDNKDILAIASRLDIAVKSHSSTIAESEADQIRSAALQSRSGGGAAVAAVPIGPIALAQRLPSKTVPAPSASSKF
jgi:hypothetical protein